MKGKIFIITGPSGAGKTSVAQKLLSDESLNLKKVITTTTRKKREGEVDGKDYYFVSEKNFLKDRDENKFFEYAKVYDNYYGSKKEDVEKILKDEVNILFVIDIQGALNIKKLDSSSIVIFIDAENINELKNRIMNRKSDAISDINNRLSFAKQEIEISSQFDFRVVNKIGKLSETTKNIRKIILNQLKV